MTPVREVLTTRGRAFLAAGLTLLVGGFLLGFTDITRVGVLMSALPLLAGLSARHSRRSSSGLVVTRIVNPERLIAGQSATVSVVVHNTSGRRTRPQLAQESVHYLLGDQPRFVLPAMEPDGIREVSYQIRSQTRGGYRLGPLTLRRRDPYDLTAVRTVLPGSTEVLVLPRVETLSRVLPRAEGFGAEGVIAHMVARHGEDDVAVRSYRNGDDLRRIHWPVTAHRSELMVRQEDHPARRHAVIVLDSRTAGHQGQRDSQSQNQGQSQRAGMDAPARESFEWAVTAAASIAAHLSRHDYTLRLATSESTAEGEATKTVEIDDVLASLATARLGPPEDFDDVLRWAHPLTATGGLVVAIVTDHDEAGVRRTAALRQREGTGVLILLDTDSFARPRPGPPSDHALALAGMAAATGWNTCVAGPGMTVAQAWDLLAARSSVTVGDGR